MTKALVSIDADLPSSIALRYTCQLAKIKPIEIQTVHVHEPDAAGPGGFSMGTGWARRTYEKELVDQSKKGISQLLVAESGFCPVLNEPIITSGDREKEILIELQKGDYDLFVEGAPFQLSSKELNRHLRSHLYQHLKVPALLVQNLYPINRVLMVMESERESSFLYGELEKVFGGQEMELELVFISNHILPAPQETSLKAMAKDRRWTVTNTYQLPRDEDLWRDRSENCDLVATVLERHKGHSSLQVEFLGQLSCPILFFWK